MTLKLELTAKDWSRNIVLLYGVTQTLRKHPDTLIKVEVIGQEDALKRIEGELKLAGLYPELDLVGPPWENMDDIP